jgi:RHS repeat-associated protein
VSRGLCLTIAAGAGAAYECGDLRLVHGLPVIRTLNTVRAPTLIYSSQTAHPYPLVTADVTLPAGDPLPTTVQATLTVNGVNYVRSWAGTAWGSAGQTRRVVVGFDAAALGTGVYAYSLEIRRITGQSNTVLQTFSGRLPIVNRATSPFRAGWWLAGYEQLFFPADTTVLWVGGDGSARRYERIGLRGADTAYAAPPLAHPDTLLHTTTGEWVRLVPGGVKVTFASSGHHSRTTNRLGYATLFTDSAGLLVRITPPGDATLAYTFTYTGSPALLSSVSVPDSTPSGSRLTTLSMVGDSLKITDPASAPVVFAYDPAQTKRIVASRDRRGTPTAYLYDAAFRLAATRLGLGGSDSINVSFCTAEARGIAACSPALVAPESAYTRFDGPRTDSADVTDFWLDSLGDVKKVRDALGFVTTIDRADSRWPVLATRVQYPNGRTIGATYDSRGNLGTSTDSSLYTLGQHATTQYQWDQVWDRVTQITLPTGEVAQFSYDATYGNRLWQQDGRGTPSRVNFAYYTSGAATGLLKTVTDALGNKDSVAYDARGNLALTKSALGYQTTTVSDRIGRQTLVRSPVSSVYRDDSTYYDQRGLVVRTASYGPGASAQKIVVRNFYNAEGELDSLQNWAEPDPATVGTITTRWRYDLAGRKVAQIAPDMTRDSTRYDPAGNPITILTRRGDSLPIQMSYDRMNRLRRRIVPSVTYAKIDSVGTATVALSNGCYNVFPWFPTYSEWDPNSCHRTVANLRIAGDTAIFSYDPMGAVISADNADAKIRRTYFKDGNVQTDTLMIRAFDDTTFGLHKYGLAYRYDLSGRRLVLKHPVQLAPKIGASISDSTRYAYTALTGTLSTVTDPLGDVFQFTYNNRNDRTRLDLPGLISERLGYDADDRLVADTMSNNSTSPFKNPDATLRRTTVQYADLERVLSAMNAVGWKDTTQDTYDGLGHLSQHQYSAPGSTNFGIPFRAYSTETSTYDALGNAYSTTDFTDVNGSTGMKTQWGNRRYRFAPLTGGRPTGRFRGVTDAYRTDSVWYDGAGNTVFTYQVGPTASNAVLEDRASWYGADGQLRAAEYRRVVKSGAQQEAWPWYMSFEQYRYDALGRRILVRTHKNCSNAYVGIGGFRLYWCNMGTIRRTVWDGSAELYEIEMLASQGDYDAGPIESDSTPIAAWGDYPVLFDANRLLGRVAYTNGPTLDQPLSTIRIAYGDTVWNKPRRWWAPFAVVPHWNWRGQADYGTFADGGVKTCWPGDNTRCVSVTWKLQPFALAQQPADTATPAWYGSLLANKEDATGLQFRRNRYVDPITGRFTQEDPLGLAGGMNLYGFVNGDPVNMSDAFGLCTEQQRKSGGCGVSEKQAAEQRGNLRARAILTIVSLLSRVMTGGTPVEHPVELNLSGGGDGDGSWGLLSCPDHNATYVGPSVGRRSIEGGGWGAGSFVMAGGRSVSLFAFVEVGAGLDMGPSASFSFWKGPLSSLSGWTLNGGFGYGGIGGQYSWNRRGSGGSFVRYQKSGIAITGSYAERIGTICY